MSGFPWLAWIPRLLQRRLEQRYWKRRVQRRGASAVLHQGHAPTELEEVTRRQRELLLPLLRRELRGTERTVLDFGCGAGRFTLDLAEVVGGSAIGVDPIDELIDLAPPAPGVEYRRYPGPRLPIDTGSIDVVWICLVLCNITDPRTLRDAAAEIDRVLKPGGLIFLVENTAEKAPAPHVRYRSAAAYQALFPGADLRHVQDHEDMGERISVLAGRKRGPGS